MPFLACSTTAAFSTPAATRSPISTARRRGQVGLDGEGDQILFELPPVRSFGGQNCVSPDGECLIYIHHDRANNLEVYPNRSPQAVMRRHLARGAALSLYRFSDGARRDLVRINRPIHHVNPLGPDRLVFCHPSVENGILVTDYDGGSDTSIGTCAMRRAGK